MNKKINIHINILHSFSKRNFLLLSLCCLRNFAGGDIFEREDVYFLSFEMK